MAPPPDKNSLAAPQVLIVMPSAELLGGAEGALRDLIVATLDRPVRWVVVFLEHGPLADEFTSLGVPTHVIPAGRVRNVFRAAGAVLSIARLARRLRADLILSWMPKAHLYGGVAAALTATRACWFQHGYPGPSVMDRLISLIPARTVLACSNAVARAQTTIDPQTPTRAVHPGIDLERFNPRNLPTPAQARQTLGLNPGGPLIGIVARLQRWKGIHHLIDAMPAILREFPDARCVVVGGRHDLEPDYPDMLRSRIDRATLNDHILLAGRQGNVPLWMHAADVVVHASDAEPFGLVIVEAMALGKPVVATRAGGVPEIVTDEIDGLLVPPNDPQALAQAILRYLRDPGLRDRIGAAAVVRASRFSTDAFATGILSVVAELTQSTVVHPRASAVSSC